MCLIKKHYLPKISDNDITVYKILVFDGLRYISPFQEVTVDIHIPQKSNELSFYKLVNSIFTKHIGDGFIHSYSDIFTVFGQKIEIELYFNVYMGYRRHKTVIFECIIPKGTLYYEGKNNDIASRKLIYKNIIKE